MKIIKKGILFLLILLLAAGIIFGFLWLKEYKRATKPGKEIQVEIKEGTSTVGVAKILQKAGVIKYNSAFLVKMYRSSYRGKLRYGTFQVNSGWSLDKIIKTIATGKSVEQESVLTIPEGYTVEMIAQKVEEKKIMKGEDFLNAVKKAADGFVYAEQLPKKEEVYYQLQGYLYPDTYYLTKDITADELVQKLLKEFTNQFGEGRIAQAKKLGLSITDVLTRASLVEKETELASEYPIIAGVINNRLKADMKLQFDSTVVYAMTEGQYGVERVLYKDLKYNSLYNTYQNKGLPPGPICNPSMTAIDAVLHPQENPYLYFQTDMKKKDGSNLFFKTYEEHDAASSTAKRGAETTTEAKPQHTDNHTEKGAGQSTKSSTANSTKATKNTTEGE